MVLPLTPNSHIDITKVLVLPISKDMLLRRINLAKILTIFHSLPSLFIGVKIQCHIYEPRHRLHGYGLVLMRNQIASRSSGLRLISASRLVIFLPDRPASTRIFFFLGFQIKRNFHWNLMLKYCI